MKASASSTTRVFKRSASTLLRFTFRRSYKVGIIWGLAFSVTTVSSALSFNSLFNTPAAKAQLIATFGNNAGLKFLFGNPQDIGDIGGFTAWRALGVMILIGAIWMLISASQHFRGNEESGRTELWLSAPSTPRRTALATLSGLGLTIGLTFLMVAIACAAVGADDKVGFSLGQSALYGFAAIATALELLCIAFLMSQIAPIRRRAMAFSAAVFGASFIVRGLGATSAGWSWLTAISPIGWIDRLQPLNNPQPIWLVPIIAFCALCVLIGLFLLGRRDLGAGLLKDKDTAKPRLRLLRSPLGFALRQTRPSLLGWWAGAVFIGLLYGSIAKTTAQALNSTEQVKQVISQVAGQSSTTLGVETFISVLFLLLLIMILIQATNLLGAIREDEADGYVDNLLVRAVSRPAWLSGRLAITSLAVLGSAFIGSLAAWAGEASQHAGVAIGKLLLAGVNIMPAALFMVAIGLLVFGWRPRLTTPIMYGVIAWSFLVEIIGGAIKLNHYFLDLSLLHHVALAPATDPNWKANGIFLLAAAALIVLGSSRFFHRDLVNE